MNNSSTDTNCIPTAADIEAINALYKKCRACSDELSAAYVEWDRRRDESVAIRTLQQKYEKASKAFDDFKRRVGEVKFDIERGEYFPARDESGKEVFRIKVTRTQTLTMTIASTSEEFALQTAKAAIIDGKAANFGPVKYAYEDISR